MPGNDGDDDSDLMRDDSVEPGAEDPGGDVEQNSFLLYDSDAVRRLVGRPFFLEAIAQFYVHMAEIFGCDVTLSRRRIGEAHDFWLSDVSRTLTHGTNDETKELDHFKNAAFIAFWLRQRGPINDITFQEGSRLPLEGKQQRRKPSAKQIQFYRYGGEICALYVGFYICLAYEVARMTQEAMRADPPQIYPPVFSVRELPPHFLSEFPKLLKHKSISPYALYMVYRSLFDTLIWVNAAQAGAPTD